MPVSRVKACVVLCEDQRLKMQTGGNTAHPAPEEDIPSPVDSHLGGEVITGLHAHGVFNYRISVLLRAKPSLVSQSVPLPTQELPHWLPNGLLL